MTDEQTGHEADIDVFREDVKDYQDERSIYALVALKETGQEAPRV